MSSKKLESILSKVPPATATNSAMGMSTVLPNIPTPAAPITVREKKERINAEIPAVLKEEIRNYLRNNAGETERTLLLKALKSIGFNVLDTWLIDNRSTR